MRYTKTQKTVNRGYGKTIFGLACALGVVFMAAFFSLQPPPFGELTCATGSTKGCGCPTDSDEIRFRHVIIVDVTDPLRRGKYDDIERLISAVGTTPRPLLKWLGDGKRVDMTSVFVISNTAVADMQPVAKFCTPPPFAAQYAGFKGREIKELGEQIRLRTKDAVNQVISASGATQSAIVETLATVVQSPSHWVPGSTLVLASDLMQNTSTCGWFTNMSVIPPLGSTSQKCKSTVREFQEGILPNSAHRGTSVVAFCSLPGKDRKPGLHAFWSEIVKGPLNSDVLYSCDPAEILARRNFLNRN